VIPGKEIPDGDLRTLTEARPEYTVRLPFIHLFTIFGA
jgi:hypothetical protein